MPIREKTLYITHDRDEFDVMYKLHKELEVLKGTVGELAFMSTGRIDRVRNQPFKECFRVEDIHLKQTNNSVSIVMTYAIQGPCGPWMKLTLNETGRSDLACNHNFYLRYHPKTKKVIGIDYYLDRRGMMICLNKAGLIKKKRIA